MLCRVAGAGSVLSSEVSAFLITLISIDRFLGVKYPLRGWRLETKSARILVIILWLIAFSLTITTFVLSGEESIAYSISEVCVGLPISRFRHYVKSSVTFTTEVTYEYKNYRSTQRVQGTVSQITYDHSGASMYISIAIFTGLNLICFSIVGVCYTAIFITARKTTRASGRSQTSKDEMRMALKVSLLVLTDFLCWVPVGILSILV